MAVPNHPQRTHSTEVARREFLKQSAAIAAATTAGIALAQSAHAAGNDVIKIGLIGCGGRGSGAVLDALGADRGTQLTAMGDVFEDKLDAALKNLSKSPVGKRIKVKKDRCFVGLDAYKKVLETDVDMVILAAPGGFRPPHLKAAIEAGKHVFCEKPMAVDAPGLRKVIQACEEAKKKNLAIRAGLVFRFHPVLQEAFQRIHDGQIGDVLAMYSTRMGSSLSTRFNGERKPGWSDLEWQLRNWSNFSWLSGDWMMEVACHEVDKIAWAMRDIPPTRCIACGGRSTPTFGDIFDHFDVTYEYGELGASMLGILKTRYEDGCFGDFRHIIIGSKGRCTLGVQNAAITGQKPWKPGKPKPGEKSMFHHEHETLFKQLRAGNPPNDGDRMVKSVLMSLMGRMSAYTGQAITWDMAMNSKEDTMPADLSWDMKLPVRKVPVPGMTKFV
jgi:predicted dehydrogenase